MAETLFPQRQRCKTCRGNLGKTVNDPVLFGLYCSPKCAGIAEPSANAGYQGTPRECRTQRDGGWFFKRRYRSEGEIPDKIRDDPSTNWYWCGHCGTLHVGHTRVGTAEKFRMFEDLGEDLPDLLVKLRGKATLKQVAEVAGIRPIRLKELETGVDHPEGLKTLGKVLKVYRVRLGVALPAAGR
ncbi:helix-turn-helix domain-containing protein, partial [Arthrobacter sp. Hiyo1]|uniref:helix-turn-helix domain-containing protein n=1 Tax=Arthrobacter sp. Hiyo1 TaxID=1588020 RepID=UPI000AB3AB81